jgi:hypothetical protein
MATAAIMAGGTILSSLLNGIFGNKAASTVAAGQLNAANAANSIQNNQYQLTRSDLAPYTSTGQSAITTLGNLLGIGPKPGSVGATAGPTTLPQDALDKQSKSAFLKAWLAGQNPAGANGEHIGEAPHNPATVAKVQGEIDQLDRDVQSAQQIAQNTANQQNLLGQQNPEDYGSLMKDFTAADFNVNTDPGAQYRMDQAQKAIERSAAARGGVQSGGTLKALQSNSQDLASQEFGNAYNRFQNNRQTKANLLLGTAGLGQVSLGQQANLGAGVANQQSAYTAMGKTGSADALASGYANTGSSINSALSGLLDLWNAHNNGGNSGGGSSAPIYSTPPFISSSIPMTSGYRAPSLRLN